MSVYNGNEYFKNDLIFVDLIANFTLENAFAESNTPADTTRNASNIKSL